MKEGTGGLSPPMTKRFTGFGAELVHRPGANKNSPCAYARSRWTVWVRVVLEGYLVCTRGGQKTSSGAQKC